MSLLRSPTGSGLSGSRSDSQPNLSSCNQPSEFSESSTITYRNKRKFIDDNTYIREEIAELRTQTSKIMTILTSLRDNQNEFIEKINKDVNDIKNQISDIKITTDYLKAEQNIIKTDISDIVNKNVAIECKIKNLETEFQLLKENQTQTNPTMISFNETHFQDMLNEINERETRNKNIIINGIKEQESNDKDQRKNLDTKEVVEIIKSINNDCPSPLKVFRLGKFQSNINRPIKVCFASQEIAKSILRNKNKANKDSISIYSDQTPQQRKYLSHLKEELKKQIGMGKKNLTIKFIKNVPKIVEVPPKNQ